MAFQSEIAGSQIDGARDYQEDAFLITHLNDSKGKPSALIIVADGMGGHAAGNVASNMAVQAFNKYISSNYPAEDVSETLNQSLLKANAAITDTVKETPALDGMGCTMIGAIIEGKNLWWVSVGDSHLYLLRDRKLTKLNADHSYGGFLDRMEAAGTPVDAEPGLSRNMLMSAVTGTDIAEIDCPPTPIILQHDDKLIVCSDGMDTLSEGKIIQYSDWADSPKECADALMDAVEDAAMPRQDNTTAVVVKIIDDTIADVAGAEDEDNDDDADITTPGAAKTDDAVEEDTIEMDAPTFDEESPVVEEAASDTEAHEEIVLSETPDVVDEIVETIPDIEAVDISLAESTPEKSKTGLIVGIAAGALIAIAAGAFFIFGGSSDKSETGDMGETIDSIVSEEIMPEATISDEETPAPIDETESTETEATEEAEVAKPASEPEVVAAEPQAAPESATKSAIEKEFQDNLKDGGKSPVMIVIPAGSFEMGSSASSRFSDERPRHTVKVKSIAVSKYEVTFAEYDQFAKANNRKPPDDLFMDRETHPVIFVKWDDAYYYAKWLSEQTGHQYRLLSESEWEYAASTGKKSTFWWGYNEEPGKAHCFGCDSGLDPRKPSKTGGFDANNFGLYDTSGNVAEWVQDCWHDNYNGAPADGSVWEGGDCNYRVVRGGAYLSPQQSIRNAKRDKLKSDAGYDHVGIRLARELD